jgi:hypothetical protein
MSTIQVLTEFKNNLVQFFDALIDLFPHESDFVLLRILIKDQVPVQEVMNVFITNLLPYKQAIKARDEKVLLSLSFLPEGVDKNKVGGTLKRIWLNRDLDDDNRAVIWQWMNIFVMLVERYQKTLVK